MGTSVGTSGHGTCRRVLLVDSCPISRAITEMKLLAGNYTVMSTGCSIEALAILFEHEDEFDFVLTDIDLSDDREGPEFLDTLDDESDIVVFVLSANTDEEVIEEAFKKGACIFFQKPIDKEHVEELWEHALNEKLRRQSLEAEEEISSPFDVDEGKFSGEWTSSLHDQFIEAVKEIGLKYVDAKNIHEFMNVPGLTKKDVAEHLRIYFPSLMRMEQEGFDKQAQGQENQDCASSSRR